VVSAGGKVCVTEVLIPLTFLSLPKREINILQALFKSE
jgi:hypothetical protein